MTHLSSTSVAQIVVFVITSTEQGMESLLFDNMFVQPPTQALVKRFLRKFQIRTSHLLTLSIAIKRERSRFFLGKI